MALIIPENIDVKIVKTFEKEHLKSGNHNTGHSAYFNKAFSKTSLR